MAKQDATVELYYDGQWNAATTYERQPITIKHGYAGESRQSTPGTAGLALDNRTGAHNPANPMSALWGLAGRNTPCRVSLDGEVRFHGEVSSWKPGRALKGDAWTDVEASGVGRRLGQGKQPEHPALRRAITAAAPLAYWPLDDGKNATRAASALAGGTPMTAAGTVTFATIDPDDAFGGGEFYATAAVPDFSDGGSLTATVPAVTATGWAVQLGCAVDLFASGTSCVVARWSTPGGTYTRWDLRVLSFADGDGAEVIAYTAAGTPTTVVTVTGAVASIAFDELRVDAAQDGADIDVRVWWAGTVRDSATLTSATLAMPTTVALNPDRVTQPVSWAIGHLQVFADADAPTFETPTVDAAGNSIYPWLGFDHETAADRIVRLCAEQGVTATVVGNAADSQPMGFQPAATTLALLAACEATDGGLLYEPRTSLGVAYRTRHDLYNQPATLALDMATGGVAPPIAVDIDDKLVRNDVTVKRREGSSARREQLTGPMSVLAPPDGVGRVTHQAETQADSDDILDQHAAWLLHLGTWDEPRWPRVTVDLDAAPHLTAAAEAVDVGDVITVDNLDPGQVQLMVLGYTETIGTHRRLITYNCAPQAPWEVWQLQTGGSTLTKDAAAAATTLTLDTSAGPAWSTTDEPYHVQVDGEAMTVTAMADDTITYVGAGAAVHGADGASVAPDPHASTAAGDLMLLYAAVRDTAAVVDDLTGWTELAELANIRVFARYYRDGTGADNPTVTFTGGGAGDDTSAQIATFRGASLCLDDGAYQTASPSPQTQANGSAADIAYPALSVRRPGCVVLYLGWKADDWTSVASPGDAEIGEPDTTTGDDHGVVWSYDIQTTPADVAAGSFTVTGGGAAVSKGITLALRPTQTATVTRAVNGVSKALTVGEAATGWRLGVVAL